MKRKASEEKTTEIKKRITLASDVSVEMEEKKSIFIGHATPVENEEQAREYINAKKKEFHDATHNVYAYLLADGAIARYSDDGEPSGTAGMPVLNVVKMSGASDLCVVVTRYFGGILLGAGGLVRAYTASAKLAVDEAGIAVFEPYAIYRMEVSYSDYQKLTAALPKIGVSEDSCDFADNVIVTAAIEISRADDLVKMFSELTYGKGKIAQIGTEERASRT